MHSTSYIEQCVAHLRKGDTILYPTDTIWGIGGDATREDVIEKIFDVKRRSKEKSLIVLVDSIQMLKQYVEVSAALEQLIVDLTVPTTIIYSNPRNLAPSVVASTGTVAIRIPSHDFCKSLIKSFGKPIVSTSANISGEISPAVFEDISEEIKANVDCIVSKEYDTSEYKQASRLIRILPDGSLEYLR